VLVQVLVQEQRQF